MYIYVGKKLISWSYSLTNWTKLSMAPKMQKNVRLGSIRNHSVVLPGSFWFPWLHGPPLRLGGWQVAGGRQTVCERARASARRLGTVGV